MIFILLAYCYGILAFELVPEGSFSREGIDDTFDSDIVHEVPIEEFL